MHSTDFSLKTLLRLTAVSAAMLLAGCGTLAPRDAAPASEHQAAFNTRWADFLHQFQEDYFVANPSFAVTQGRHEFDGQLPDWRAASLQRRIEQLDASRVQAGCKPWPSTRRR